MNKKEVRKAISEGVNANIKNPWLNYELKQALERLTETGDRKEMTTLLKMWEKKKGSR